MIRALLLVTTLTAGICAAADVTIVEDGKSDYTIIIPPEATGSERFAAVELAKYIKQMSGALLPVREATQHLPKAIFVHEYDHSMGPAERMRAERSPQTPEDFWIGVLGQSVWIEAGSRHSLLHGVYELCDGLGCRWL